MCGWAIFRERAQAWCRVTLLVGLAVTGGAPGCATTASRCEQSISECIGRCQATMPDSKPALTSNPEYDTMSECESRCDCRKPSSTTPTATPKPTPTGFAQ